MLAYIPGAHNPGGSMAYTNWPITKSTIGPDELLTVRFPDLKENQMIIPETTKLTFNISLAGTDANRTLVHSYYDC